MQCGPDLIELHTWFTSFYFKLRFRNLWCWLLPKAGGNHPIFKIQFFLKFGLVSRSCPKSLCFATLVPASFVHVRVTPCHS